MCLYYILYNVWKKPTVVVVIVVVVLVLVLVVVVVVVAVPAPRVVGGAVAGAGEETLIYNHM